MPRPNPPRDVYAEEFLAQRIQIERERRGWSYEGLAKRMTEAGCPVNQSALYKVEQSQPRRRITVDELVALARVFDTSTEDLLTDPRLLVRREVVPLLDEWLRLTAERMRVVQETDARMEEIQTAIAEKVADDPEMTAVVREYFASSTAVGESWRERLADIVLDVDPESGT